MEYLGQQMKLRSIMDITELPGAASFNGLYLINQDMEISSWAEERLQAALMSHNGIRLAGNLEKLQKLERW